MNNSRKLERTNVIHTIRDLEQFKEEYKKLWENYDYFVTDTLKKALNSKFHHRNIFYVEKEKIFICVTEKTMTEKITELLKNIIMDWAYFDRMEIEDFNKIKEINEDLKWFTKLERNTLFDRIDIEAKDRKGRSVNIELKSRIISIDKYDTIYIEEDKYKHMIMKWENDGEIPLYINFFNGGIVGVWDLRKFPNPEITNVRIYNKGRQTIENVNRYILPVEGCIKLGRGDECRYCIMNR